MDIKPLMDLLLKIEALVKGLHSPADDKSQEIDSIKESAGHRHDELDAKLISIAQNQQKIYNTLNTRVKVLEDNFSQLKLFVEQNTDDLRLESLSSIRALERLDVLEYKQNRFRIPRWIKSVVGKIRNRLPEIYMFGIGCILSGTVAAAVFWLVTNTN